MHIFSVAAAILAILAPSAVLLLAAFEILDLGADALLGLSFLCTAFAALVLWWGRQSRPPRQGGS